MHHYRRISKCRVNKVHLIMQIGCFFPQRNVKKKKKQNMHTNELAESTIHVNCYDRYGIISLHYIEAMPIVKFPWHESMNQDTFANK